MEFTTGTWFLTIIRYALCKFFHLYQVVHLGNHTQDLRSSFHFYRSVELFKTQRYHGFFLTFGAIDYAFDLRDFNFFHTL